MNINELTRHFASIGARAKVKQIEQPSRNQSALSIDILNDRQGEFFQFDVTDEAPEVQLLQAAPKDRHLLLFTDDKQRFLCGHDERHWFVAEIGEPVSTVRAAKQALMPETVRERAKNVAVGKVDNRRNDLFFRQGEWFFVPVEIDVPEKMILRNEPLQRTAGSKPHIVQELYRQGGEAIYIVAGRAYTEQEFRNLRRSIPEVDLSRMRQRVGNARVYARGTVRHSDHATIRLDGWHEVMINAEPARETRRNSGMQFPPARIAFLD